MHILKQERKRDPGMDGKEQKTKMLRA